MRDIPVERYAGQTPNPVAVYRIPILAALAGIGMLEAGIAAFSMTYPVGGPAVPQTQARETGSPVPFRRATTMRHQKISVTGPQVVTTSQQQVQVNIEGSGYIYGLDLHVQSVVPSTNAATVVATEDAPWAALASVVFADVNGELVNLDGFSLHLLDMYGGYRSRDETASADTSVYSNVTGTGATAGNFQFHLWVPVGTNERDLIGILGNQDRAQRYNIRDDIAASSVIWSTPPTALPNLTITRTYESFTVPAAVNARNQRQEQIPPKFGVLHYGTKTLNPGATPQGGATVNHYLARLGNTIRLLILVLRANGSRATAEANAPTLFNFKIGDVPIYTVGPAYQRQLMYQRYGFDAPNGVYVFDAIADFKSPGAGTEYGEDYWWTNGLNNAQFEITYPSGFGSTNNSLTIITDDLQVPAGIDLYA